MDQKENKRKFLVCPLKSKAFSLVQRESQTIRVGDILKVNADEVFPADIVLLSTADRKSVAFVSTKSLDGESNLKTRVVSKSLSKISTQETFEGIKKGKLTISVIPPVHQMHEFNGRIDLNAETSEFLSYENLVPRGAVLKVTESIMGVAVYTGEETKIRLNSMTKQAKLSELEKKLNVNIVIIIIVDIGICVSASSLYVLWTLAKWK